MVGRVVVTPTRDPFDDCAHGADVRDLYQREGEAFADYLERLGATYRAAPSVQTNLRPRPRRDRSYLLRLLSADRWTTSHEIGRQVGQTSEHVRFLVGRLIREGAPIESGHRRGYRLRETAS